MIAYYPFEGDFQDALGDAQKAFVPGGEPNFISGYKGLGASFDGINDSAVTTSFVFNDFSIAFWINTTDFYVQTFDKFWDGKGLVNAGETACTSQGDWGICLQDTNKAAFGIGAICEDETAIRSGTPINDGQWHFVCCTRDGYTGVFKIYVDEGPAESEDQYTPVFPRDARPMYLAAVQNEAGKFLNGILDELVFYDHVLGQEEIDDLRRHGVNLPGKAELIAPADGADNLPYNTVLQWTHPDLVERYKVYLDTDAQLVAEPNFPYQPMLIGGEEIFPASGMDPNAMLVFDPQINTDYYWRVDSRVIEPNWSYINPDTNEPYYDIYTWVKGDVWSFSGLPETVVFTISGDKYILPDPITHVMPVDPVVQFSVHVLAAREIHHYEWHKNGEDIFGAQYSAVAQTDLPGEVLSVLTIDNAGEQNEGAYEFKVKLDDPMEDFFSPPSSLYVSSEFIVHRYSFSGNVLDSVGDANGLIIDPNYPNITFDNGQIVFDDSDDGDSSNDASGDPNAHFVDLPNGLISSLGNNMTLMIWFTWEDAAATVRQRVFDFGINAEGLEGQSTGTADGNFLRLTPRHDSVPNPKMRVESHFPGLSQSLNAAPALYDQEVCAAITWSSEDDRMRMYVDGQLVDEKDLNGKLSDLDDRNNWLARSQWQGDPLFVGRINELRIYNIPLAENWVAALYQKGPDSGPLDADPCIFSNPVDLNGDCVVDLADFAVFAENWIWCGLLSCQ